MSAYRYLLVSLPESRELSRFIFRSIKSADASSDAEFCLLETLRVALASSALFDESRSSRLWINIMENYFGDLPLLSFSEQLGNCF